MRSRLFALLLVATFSGLGAAASSRSAQLASKRIRPPRLPALPSATAVQAAVCPLPHQFRAAFVRAARDTNLQLAMLVAVAEVESQFQPTALSKADAHGLLQVLPSTAASLHLDVDNPASNVLAGARYLKLLISRYQSADTALAAYNAGPTAVDRAGGVAPNHETEAYVSNVEARWHALAGCR